MIIIIIITVKGMSPKFDMINVFSLEKLAGENLLKSLDLPDNAVRIERSRC